MKPSEEYLERVDEIRREYKSGVFPLEVERERNHLITRAISFRDLGVGGRDGARADLDASAYYHIQPCNCDKCDPRYVCAPRRERPGNYLNG